jgi:hypothetical protein
MTLRSAIAPRSPRPRAARAPGALAAAAIAAAAALVGAARPAAAQPGASPPPLAPQRTGLELALGLWGGEISCESEGGYCDGFTEAVGGSLTGAYFARPTLALMIDFWPMVHDEREFRITHYLTTLGAKWRPLPILTVTVGFGASRVALDYNGILDAQVTSEAGAAAVVAIALEVVRARRWALAVEARGGVGFYGDANDNARADFVGRSSGVGGTLTVFGF